MILVCFMCSFYIALPIYIANVQHNKTKQFCDSYPTKEYIDGILYHIGNNYTYFALQENNILLERNIYPKTDDSIKHTITFVKDVPLNDRNWVQYTPTFDGKSCNIKIEFHISGFKDYKTTCQ